MKEINLDIKNWGARFLEPFGEEIEESCDICGDCHYPDNIPLSCQTGDGE